MSKIKNVVKIRADLATEFESLPARRGVNWTPEMDEIVLRYYKQKKTEDFITLFEQKFHVGIKCNAFRKRFRYLKQKSPDSQT